jgi:hypothetical protein
VRGVIERDAQSASAAALVVLWPVVTEQAGKIDGDALSRVADDTELRRRMVRRVRGQGGDLTVTAADGSYQLYVVLGDYYWMVIEAEHTGASPPINSRALAELGRYVEGAADLTRHRRTAWKQLHVNQPLRLNHTWDAAH